MIYDRKIETMSRAEIAEMQLAKMKKIVAYAYEFVPMYKKRFDEIGLRPDHIRTLKDVENIPYTTKDDLRNNYPYGLFAVPMREIVRVHASSGTTGKPIVGGYTKYDLENWSVCIARILAAGRATEDDIIQVSFGYGLFTGGFGLHYGIEKLGATVVPMSSGNTERQLMIMKDFGVTGLVATPSYAIYLGETAKKMGIIGDLKVKNIFIGAEASTKEMHDALTRIWGALPTENYGLTEVGGPGVSGECEYKRGMHINEDFFYPEIVNVEENKVLSEGEYGEMLITTLDKRGMPILRYRTKDITALDYSPCECGRTTARMARIIGRTDDMMVIRGVNVFPSQIESVIMGIPELGTNYEIVVERDANFMDTIEVHVEVGDSSLLTNYANLENLVAKTKAKLRTVVQLDVKVKLVEPFGIKRGEGKVKRVIDKRKVYDK